MIRTHFTPTKTRAAIAISLGPGDVHIDQTRGPMPRAIMEPAEARWLATKLLVMAELVEDARRETDEMRAA